MQKIHALIAKNFDLSVSVLMGVATVLTAFFVFCAALWGSTSVANYSKANTELNEANTTYLEYNNAFIQDDLRELRLTMGGLSDKDAEQETEEANKEIEILLAEYNDLKNNSDQHLKVADEANSHGDKFQLVAVILATILFLASMSLQTRSENNRFVFFYISLSFLVLTLLYSLTFSFPFGV